MLNSSPNALAYWIDVSAWGLGVASLFWMAVSITGWLHRRAYRLTIAETAEDPPPTPQYLDTHEARRLAAKGKGESYDTERKAAAHAPHATKSNTAPAPTAGPIPAWLEGIAMVGSTSAAILTIGFAIAAVILTGGPGAVDSPLLADGWSSLIEHRWPVLGGSLIVLGVSLLRILRPKAQA